MNKLDATLHELTADAWAMEPARLHTLFAQLAQLSTRPLTILPAVQIAAPAPQLQIRTDGTAVVPIKGILTKQALPAWMAFFGIEGTTYGQIRQMVGAAVADPTAKRIELQVESPGGQVSGCQETAEAIAAAALEKPVTAGVEDLAASAAYWLASQATEISANPNAFVGSIGVYTVYADYSEMAKREGVTVHVIRSGEHKGMGVPGAPISAAQIAAMQENVDRIADHFIAAVATGRALAPDEARALATGRMWEATAARELKLIDAVTSPGVTAPIAISTNAPRPKGDLPMDPEKSTAATAVDAAPIQAAERQRLSAFRTAFPKDPEFAMAQFEAGATVTEAKAAYSDILAARLEARATQEVAVVPGASATIGTAAAEGNEAPDADEGPDFLTVARQYAAAHHCTMAMAMPAVRKSDKTLHERYLRGCLAQARPRAGSVARIDG